jgi:guanosine-3',5'-bis(diphosphate) 3'-pyrophosphohydrolase
MFCAARFDKKRARPLFFMHTVTNPKQNKRMNTFTDTPDLLRAILYAIEMHDDQRRKNAAAKPYVTHPISVALRLVRAGVTDTNVLCAAVLHDVVEDTKGTLADIEARFGPIVARIVGEVTDDKSLSVVDRKKLQIVHAKTMSREAKLVKLADKLDNCSEIATAPPATWTRERVEGYLVWTAAVLEGLAGTSEILETQLKSILNGFVQDTQTGEARPMIPAQPSREEQLENYFALLAAAETRKQSAAEKIQHIVKENRTLYDQHIVHSGNGVLGSRPLDADIPVFQEVPPGGPVSDPVD